MEWLPTLPQLFAYLGFTQFLLMFWIFIGECANDVAATWNLVMMWWVKWFYIMMVKPQVDLFPL